MGRPSTDLFLADSILVIHALFVAFVVFGLILTVLGLVLHWRWVRNLWFRLAHLVSILAVVVQAWAGRWCPLTIWESALRERAGGAGYEGSFVQYWVHRIIFYEAEPWVFTLAYTAFGALTVLTWRFGPPRGRCARHTGPE
jgi:hypothetical protein